MERKICVVTLDCEPYAMALTEDQIKLVKWIADRGYDISIEVQSEIINI